MGERDGKLRMVEVRADVLDTITANSYARDRALQRAESLATRWHDIWAELLGQVGDLYHRAKNRPKGKRYATVLELENLLRVDPDAPERPTVLTMGGETTTTGEDDCGGLTFVDTVALIVDICPAPTPRAS